MRKKLERHLNWICAWLVHSFTGIALGSEAVHTEQNSLQEAYRRDVSPGPLTGDLSSGRLSGLSPARAPSSVRRTSLEGNPRA
jgi:hypothetical protein